MSILLCSYMVVKLKKKNAIPLGQAQLQEVSELFSVLSEPTRLRMIQALHDGPLSVGQIVQATGVRQANASRQLGILHHAGVLSRKKEGNSVLYSIRLPLVLDLCALVCNSLRQDARAKVKLLE